MAATLPRFSRGLKLVRVGVFLMLLQLVLVVVTTVMTLGADNLGDALTSIEWVQYGVLANLAAMAGMLVGVAGAIPELRQARMNVRSMVISAAGFAVAGAALWWTYDLLSTFLAIARAPDGSMEDLVGVLARVENAKWAAIAKDLAYAIGLISVCRMVQRSAALNDRLALRDEAGSMSRALIVMLLGDLFYQLTYGLGSDGGMIPGLGLVAALLIAGYWIFCHVRLVRFLENAAYFMNEPHDLPLATVVRVPDDAPDRPPAPRTSRPSLRRIESTAEPAAAPPPVVVPTVPAPTPAAPPPRAASVPGEEDGGEVPKFLR